MSCDQDVGAGQVRLTVRDDGSGFDVAETRAGGAAGKSFGLLGMAERASLGGGRIEIRSSAQGTEIRASLPLA